MRANAYPRKHFFFEMFTRDISLQGCILDLVDNSIDGLIRTDRIDVSAEILKPIPTLEPAALAKLPTITITYSGSRFTIDDECGGISRKAAKEDVFTFGHERDAETTGHLGVYGIGLKRAIFKIGGQLEMKSRTITEGWEVRQNLREWAEKDDELEDWTFPLTYVDGAGKRSTAGTKIVLTDLHSEVKDLLQDEAWGNVLLREIAQTYCYFLDRYVRIVVNGDPIAPLKVPIAESGDIKAGIDEFNVDGVDVTLMAGLNGPKDSGHERAGWYVLCNARVTISADKTDLTGWGVGGLPGFHSKYVRFVGLVLFHSVEPLKLPWTTTKRGLNRESRVYVTARGRMATVAKPVLSFLSRMYPTDAVAEPVERSLADSVRVVDVRQLVGRGSQAFRSPSVSARAPKTTVRIQYDAKIRHIDAIRKHVRKTISANKIGEMTFDYYLEQEGLR